MPDCVVSDNIQLTHAAHRPTGQSCSLSVLAHNIESAANIGSLFRLADALGLEKLYLSGSSVRPPNPTLRKTSRSTDRAVDWQAVEQPRALLQTLKQQGYRIISLELTTRSIDLEEAVFQPGDKVCLIAGSEKHGIEQGLLDASDDTVHITMQGQNSSMNVAMACAIAAYQIRQAIVKAV